LNPKTDLQTLLGETDIYLLDQIMKGRYTASDKILDAGCGNGRNMHWFLQNGFDIYGIDSNEEAISQLKLNNPELSEVKFEAISVEQMNFPDNYFNHIISSAVLHFSKDSNHFYSMLEEMVRVLKTSGSLFIRMTSDIGIEDKIRQIADGVYVIPDGSKRFLITKTILTDCMNRFNLSFIEPLKTVNVDDQRCMSTLLLRKN
jgi:tellurite methyltransferase